MKKRLVRLAALVLALLTIVVSAVACSSGQTLLSLGKQKISLNLYELYLSRQKGTLCTTYYYGSEAKYDDFWDTTIDTDGTTYNDYWTSYILYCVKVYLAAMYMFEEEYKLTLPDEYIEEVDEYLYEFIIGDGDGSKAALNAILADYGVNYNMLRDAYMIEAKVDYLQQYLYGSDLSKVSDELKEQYYQDNYVRFKQVFLANYYYVYETDEDGTVIYYEPGEESETGKILYDKSTGIRKFDENGKALTDEDGSIIYYNEDGTIAYDKVNGVPAYTYDENGNFKTELHSDEKMAELLAHAEDIAEFTTPGDTKTFEDYIEKYSEDGDGQSNYPDGYYFATNAQYGYQYIVDIIEELGTMEVGEISIVESEYGYHIIMKYELDEGAYSDTDKDVWFESTTTSFTSDVMQWLFGERCEQYLDKIEVNEKLLSELDMKIVNPNFYY
ncbi:MAG: hypothetical protein IJY27_04785 [Clostridia bacterium]|nr:hypothetical protein [Clostridia bacterium]